MRLLSILTTILFLTQTPKTYNGTISYIIDGDTFILETKEGRLKIRLDGIDCPEKDQPYGYIAKAYLEKFKYKRCKVVWKKTDRYGRTIGTLYVKGENINLKMVRNGYAWHYKKYSDDEELAEAETKARQEKKGLWKQKNIIAPWEWRNL